MASGPPAGATPARIPQTPQQPRQAAAGRGPPQPANPLDVGPTTVLGERPSLVDPVVVELARLLEANAGKFEQDEPELEVRLGVLRPKEGPGGGNGAGEGRSGEDLTASGGRVQLPLSSEALVSHSSGFGYRFAPGMPPEAFVALSERLDKMSSESIPEERRVECGSTFEHTVDVLYKADVAAMLPDLGLPPGTEIVRVTIPKEGGSDVGKASVKLKLGALDLFQGCKAGEHGAALDLRAALACEIALDGFTPATHHQIVLKREKLRKTYHFRAWRIDVTTVISSEPVESDADTAPVQHLEQQKWRAPKQTHEVELEIDSFHLKRNLEAKRAGGSHRLWELLSDFLYAARDLAIIAGEPQPCVRPPAFEAAPGLDEKARDTYRRKYSKAQPVIGHYLYRLADPQSLPKVAQAAAPATGKLTAETLQAMEAVVDASKRPRISR